MKPGNVKRHQHSFEEFFNGLPHDAKIRLANRKVQSLDLDVQWCDAIGYDMADDWYQYSMKEILERRARWVVVRDALVWDREEVKL